MQSDGSPTLTFRSADDLTPRRLLRVVRGGRPQAYLNELEWADGALYANVWQSDEIVRRVPGAEYVIVPDSGHMLTLEKHQEVDEHLLTLLERVRRDIGSGAGAA